MGPFDQSVAAAERNPEELGRRGRTPRSRRKEQTEWGEEGEEKETAGRRQTAKRRKKRSEAVATNGTFLQVRQSDAGGNSSFLPALEEAPPSLLPSLPPSPVSISQTALATSSAVPRN